VNISTSHRGDEPLRLQQSPDSRIDLPRSVGFWGGSAIMVGIIIGSGIFKTPPLVAKEISSPTTILLLWAAGGVLSLFGALTFAELGTMFPRSGGVYVYLYEGLGPAIAFVFGWTYFLITKPFAASAIAMIFSEHLLRLPGLNRLHIDPRFVTCTLLLLLTWLNVTGVKQGAGAAIALTGLKFAALLAIVFAALILNKGDAQNFATTASIKPLWLALVPAMVQILWTYDGWADVTSMTGEVRQPQRYMPWILLAGTIATIGLYLAVNVVYIWLVPLAEMRGVQTVAPLVVNRLVGNAGSIVVTAMIVVSTLGATHGSIITGARVTFAQARDGLFFRSLGRIHPRYETPDVSLWVQAILSCIAVIALQRFATLSDGFVFTMWIFYAAAALAVIVLRIRRPDLPRAYKCWGYPFVPIIFIAVAGFMTVMAIADNPKEKLTWLAILVVGAPMYYVWRWLVGVRPHDPAAAR
jgi:APA family basic amino acid/polyamine antiporter